MSVFKNFLKRFGMANLSDKTAKGIVFASVAALLIHPGISYYAIFNVHPFSMNMFFLFLSLFFMFRYLNQSSFMNLILYAIAVGLSALDRVTILVAVIPFFVYSFQERKVKSVIKNTIIIVSVTFLIILPWSIRNYQVDGFFGLSSMTGKTMWKGIIEGSEGSNYLKSGKNYHTAMTPAEMKLMETMTASEQNTYFMKKWMKTVTKRPIHVIKMYFVKLKNFWWFRSQIGNEHSEALKKWIPLYKTGYGFVLLLCAFACLKNRKKILPLLTIPVALSLVQALFYVETRHRLIIEPMLLFLAIIGCWHLWEMWKPVQNDPAKIEIERKIR
ncbi:MAG: hypothetical protein JKY33_10905 [Bacteroidia bacterium]|nr:hypothetical protein [Bacteroidia bacterium]